MTEFIKEHEKEFRENYADINTKQIISSINYLLESTIPIEKVKKLEKENVTLKNFTYSIFNDNIEKEFISKQKIKNKFEKIQLLYENNLKEVDLKEVEKIDRKIFEGIRLEAQRDLARELLQESEDK